MSQLFNIIFPKFWFDVQKEYEFEFSEPKRLPFTVIADNGNLFVRTVQSDPDRHSNERRRTSIIERIASRTREIPEMLIPGLRIIAIDDEDFSHEKMSVPKFKKMIQEKNALKVKITFREDIVCGDESIHKPLGLAYGDSEAQIQNEEEKKEEQTENLGASLVSIVAEMSVARKRKSSFGVHEPIATNQLDAVVTEKVENEQMIATSFQKSFEPFQARLNNPNSCWQPQSNNLSFLQIDLKSTKQIQRMLVQGNNDHSNYVTSVWVDYSLNGCLWKSYFKREHILKYSKDEHVAEMKFWPIMVARFVRIRPHSWHIHVAVRLELFGLSVMRIAANIHNARVVTFDDIDDSYKKQLLEKTKNLPRDTTVIQVNCRQVISNALARAGVTEISWLKCLTGDVLMCAFSTKSTGESEKALDCLRDVGVGKEMGLINVMPVHYRNNSADEGSQFDMTRYMHNQSKSFAKSVKNRKLVQEMIDRVMDSAILTFDYCMNLFAASCIAVGGLATNNSVIIVASMLVSPIMGPVMAVTFGFTIREPIMIWIGVRNEAISLLFCVVIGFIFGLLYAVISENSNDWPTEKMRSRGQPVALADGAFVAIVSGIGVALSVVGDYASAVIGVAISASLLPPAVNTGMLFAFAAYIGDDEDEYEGDDHLSVMAMYSLLLTIENVILIILVAMAMFKIKDVVKIKDKNTSVWKTVTNFGSKKPLMDAKSRAILGIRSKFAMDKDNEGELKGGNFKDIVMAKMKQSEEQTEQNEKIVDHESVEMDEIKPMSKTYPKASDVKQYDSIRSSMSQSIQPKKESDRSEDHPHRGVSEIFADSYSVS